MRPVLCNVLVGRQEETRHLDAALTRAHAGAGGMVMLAGEAGIGKSRLARDVAGLARQRGCLVLTGRAVAGDIPTPFRPFAEALAAALRPGRVPGSADLGPFQPALARLVPHIEPERNGSADGSLVFLGEAVLRLIRVLAPDEGCLLILEDLHWADQETLALVEYVADNLWTEPVLCVGTYRPGESDDISELAMKLETRGSGEIVHLRHLDPDGVAHMAEACLGGALSPNVREFVIARADGIPFLIEEMLAGLLDDGMLAERDGQWEATGSIAAIVPVTFADAVGRRLDAADPDTRHLLRAAAVIGRHFEWSLLGPMTGAAESTVLSALRHGVDLQLLTTDEDNFRFRHALTHEAVLGTLLPPERALLASRGFAAVAAEHPGLPGSWCMLAADLAERAGDLLRAGELLLEAGNREIARGALSSAERTLTRARSLAGAADAGLSMGIDESLTEVFALSGQVDRALETGKRLLPRIGATSAARSAELHLLIAQAAISGGRWADAEASLNIAREIPHPEPARVDACSAQLAERQDRTEDAAKLARAALAAAEEAGLPEVVCEALEVLGRVFQLSDLDEAERILSRSAALALAHGLPLWHLRALSELGGIDMLRTGNLDRMMQARQLAVEQGALFLTAVLDLQMASGLVKQFRSDEALETASRCVAASRRFGLMALPEALMLQAAAHAIRDERDAMEGCIAEAVELAPQDGHVRGSALGRCRAMLSMRDEEIEQAWSELNAGAELLLGESAVPAAPYLGLWALVGALLDRHAAAAIALVRSRHLTRHGLIAGLVGCAEAILAGRAGDQALAEATFDAADVYFGSLLDWYRHYARRIVAEAALADNWGDPVLWLREAEAYFEARGDEAIAAACRALMRRAGVPVPRRKPDDVGVPEQLRARSITGREAGVLELVAQGLTNKEIAEQMYLSPRTVEKHVASLLTKTGLRRRSQLAGYFADSVASREGSHNWLGTSPS